MITQKELMALLNYDPDTGIFTWKVKRKSVNIGDVAGNAKKTDGYMRIKINGSQYYCHRLAWLYIHGSFPESQIDHINNDRSDNRISNLRCANYQTNAFNRKPSSRNIHGMQGIRPNRYATKWQATIKISGKNIFIGTFDTKEEAHDAYKNYAKNAHGNFYNLD